MKTKIALVLLVLIFTNFICKPDDGINVNANSILNNCNLSSVKFKSAFTFSYDNRLIVLDVIINNKKNPYRFVLDSGAPTFITDAVVADNNLDPVSMETAYDINDNRQSTKYYYLDNLFIANRRFEFVGAAGNKNIANMPALKGRADGGLIGANVMKNCIWMIDYKNRRIVITDNIDSLNIAADAFVSKMFRNESGCPVIKAVLPDGKMMNFIVDLGYNGSVLLPEKILKKPLFNDDLESNEKQILSTGFSSKVREIKYKSLKSIEIGSLKRLNVKSHSSGKNKVGLIGNEFLENYNVILDFINNRFILLSLSNQENPS